VAVGSPVTCARAAGAAPIDLIATVEAAITAAEELLGHPLILDCVNDADEIEPSRS